MLSKEDYRGYLQQMQDLEKSMVAIYKEATDLSHDEAVKNIVIGIMQDEIKHVDLVKDMKNILGA